VRVRPGERYRDVGCAQRRIRSRPHAMAEHKGIWKWVVPPVRMNGMFDVPFVI
jgi:hypothetical protein